MAKNRKNGSAAVRFGPALKAVLLCLFFGGSGVGYVWQKQQITELGRAIKQRELHYDALRRQNDTYIRVLAQMQSPRELEARVKQMNLGLVPPQPEQIVRLVDAVADEPPAPSALPVSPARPAAPKRVGYAAVR